jgi:hypothetical protein
MVTLKFWKCNSAMIPPFIAYQGARGDFLSAEHCILELAGYDCESPVFGDPSFKKAINLHQQGE